MRHPCQSGHGDHLKWHLHRLPEALALSTLRHCHSPMYPPPSSTCFRSKEAPKQAMSDVRRRSPTTPLFPIQNAMFSAPYEHRFLTSLRRIPLGEGSRALLVLKASQRATSKSNAFALKKAIGCLACTCAWLFGSACLREEKPSLKQEPAGL